MLEQVIHYQAGIYAPNSRLEPNADNIGILLNLFKDKGFNPTTETFIEVLGTIGPTPKHQLNLTTQRLDWKVTFEKERINCIWSKIEKTDSKTVDQFYEDVIEIINRIDAKFPLHGWRLFFNMKGIMSEMNKEELTRINSALLRLPSFFSEYQPVLWSTRNQSLREITLKERVEVLNVILDVKRVTMQFRTAEPSEPQDRIEVYLDINTLQTNKDQRFVVDDFEPFLDEANNISQLILSQLEELFK